MSPAQAVARLAGGFLEPIEREALQEILHDVLKDDAIDLGELNTIRDLPGMIRAVARTLQRIWTAGINLAELAAASDKQRLADIARLESSVCDRLPASMLRPVELVNRAIDQLHRARSVLGPTALRGIPDLDPVWRPLLTQLAEVVPVAWHLAHFDRPSWLETTKINVERDAAETPEAVRIACAKALSD